MNIDEVIEKIKKAVRLANKTTEAGERETALRLARSLADRNGVAFDDIVVGERNADRAILDEEREYHAVDGIELGFVCYILKTHFGVILMVTPKSRERAYMKSLSWIGSRLNIDIAKHVYHILMRESRRAWNEVSAEQRKDVADLMKRALITRKVAKSLLRESDKATMKRSAFMQGFFWQISRKLAEHPLRNDLEADIAAAERKLLAFKEEHATREQRRNKIDADADSLLAGVKAASAVNLARPCEGRQRSAHYLGITGALALTA